MQTTLKVQKKALRKAVAATLNALTSSAVEEQCGWFLFHGLKKVLCCSSHNRLSFLSPLSETARAVTERVLSLPAIRDCNSISCYLSMQSGEVNTSAIVDTILRSGEHLQHLLKLL